MAHWGHDHFLTSVTGAVYLTVIGKNLHFSLDIRLFKRGNVGRRPKVLALLYDISSLQATLVDSWCLTATICEGNGHYGLVAEEEVQLKNGVPSSYLMSLELLTLDGAFNKSTFYRK